MKCDDSTTNFSGEAQNEYLESWEQGLFETKTQASIVRPNGPTLWDMLIFAEAVMGVALFVWTILASLR
jgi:hypothetical protein